MNNSLDLQDIINSTEDNPGKISLIKDLENGELMQVRITWSEPILMSLTSFRVSVKDLLDGKVVTFENQSYYASVKVGFAGISTIFLEPI